MGGAHAGRRGWRRGLGAGISGAPRVRELRARALSQLLGGGHAVDGHRRAARHVGAHEGLERRGVRGLVGRRPVRLHPLERRERQVRRARARGGVDERVERDRVAARRPALDERARVVQPPRAAEQADGERERVLIDREVARSRLKLADRALGDGERRRLGGRTAAQVGGEEGVVDPRRRQAVRARRLEHLLRERQLPALRKRRDEAAAQVRVELRRRSLLGGAARRAPELQQQPLPPRLAE